MVIVVDVLGGCGEDGGVCHGHDGGCGVDVGCGGGGGYGLLSGCLTAQ